MNTNEELLRLLTAALDTLCAEHAVTPKEVGVRAHHNGAYTIEIKGDVKLWFFDEFELVRWMIDVNENNPGTAHTLDR